MIIFALDPDTNDMSVDASGNFKTFTKRIEAIAQNLICRLQTFLGEIPTNLDLGVDYHGVIFNEFLPEQTKINELVKTILATEGVQSIENFSIAPNNLAGEISYDFAIITDAGSIQFSELL